MRSVLGIVLVPLCVMNTATAADSIPRHMQGLWTDTPMTCAAYKNRGAKFLTQPRPGQPDIWVRITASAVTGTTKGSFVRSTGARSVEVLDAENPNIMIDFTLPRDGFLEETVVGARASMMYVRCR
ncbi:hypothetical protein ILT44_22480 [Microvirga sp. BT689]|uniref:hypothetical protein n=1 Tax=Microvirga arvi TaxID=2778731 RepID=UPI00194E012E|nr:hypothetical protein [Microvirga arvi]MBM6582974.1 hypothetical protein [Microvirga arvi]